jgi:hypothetical protein
MPGKLKHIVMLEKIINRRVKEINCIYTNLITVLVILLGILVYIFSEYFFNYRYNIISHFYFYYFTFQTLIIANRGMNYLLVHTEKYFPFPVKKKDVFFLNIISIIWDRNVILSILLFQIAITYNLNADITVKVILITIALLTTLFYYIFIIAFITFLPSHIKENKKIYIVYLLFLIYVEGITRLSQANYLWDIYPFSGWIGSAAMAAYHGNFFIVSMYFLIIISFILLVSLLSIRFMYPRGKYV